MAGSKKKQRVTTLNELVPETSRRSAGLEINVEPKNDGQREVFDLWSRSRILFLIGPAGVGKTHIAMALALRDALKVSRSKGTDRGKVMLSRPMVTIDEDIGHLPGDVNEKTAPWLLPFHDVLTQISFNKFDELSKEVDLEMVPIGMMRGRTILNGTLIVDEAQNASYEQLKCVLTRIGRNSKIVICGDPDQSDKYDYKNCPLNIIADRLTDLDTVSVVDFDGVEDQLRDPIISNILDLI
jgi:phosphate starvation-inducible PhoH-like protein